MERRNPPHPTTHTQWPRLAECHVQTLGAVLDLVRHGNPHTLGLWCAPDTAQPRCLRQIFKPLCTYKASVVSFDAAQALRIQTVGSQPEI